jgi:DNA modification methylase
MAWTNLDKPVKLKRYMWNGMLRANKELRGDHPTQKPITLMMAILRDFTKENDIILDPYFGSGTTCVAAKNLNRKSIGIEINPKYCEIAVKRLRQEVFDFRINDA